MNTLALHLLDLLNNSYRSGADTVKLEITEYIKESVCFIDLSDNGQGMSDEILLQAGQPLFSTKQTGRNGMGLPLALQHAEATGGYLKLISQEGKGTRLQILFNTRSEAMLPWGDVTEILAMCITSYPRQDLIYTHYVQGNCFHTSSKLLKAMFQQENLPTVENIRAIRKYLTLHERQLNEYKRTISTIL